MTELFYEKEARDKLLAGAEKLYNAVKTTLGPRGRNVVIGKRGVGPTVTHDGVTVARSVHIKDEGENVGAELIKEAASKLEDAAGDGTTTVTVLTYHLLKEAAALIESGANPMQLAREVDAAKTEVAAYLMKTRRKADDLTMLTQIASLSAGDEAIGATVAEVVHAVGATGTVSVQPSAGSETSTEIATGVHLNNGWLAPYMVTDVRKGEAVYDDAAIIIMNKTLYTFKEILPLLESVRGQGFAQAVIVANDVEGDALASLRLNNEQGAFRTLIIKAPSFDEKRRSILEDLAVVTGGVVIASDSVALSQATFEHVGTAKRVVATRTKTTFMGCGGDLEGRLLWLRDQLDETKDAIARSELESRISQLAGQVAIIHVGGQTDTEVEERKFRVDDAVAATKAALAEGYLLGGGTALYTAPISGKSDGAQLLATTLKQPFRQLMENSGVPVEHAEKIVKDKPGTGINVKTGEAVDLLKEGIIDPYMVTHQALETAVSLGIAGMTAGALIVEETK